MKKLKACGTHFTHYPLKRRVFTVTMDKKTILEKLLGEDLLHKIRWSWLVRNVLYLSGRIGYYLKHGKDNYGKPGFTQLMFRGQPVIVDPSAASNEVWEEQEDGTFKKTKIPGLAR